MVLNGYRPTGTSGGRVFGPLALAVFLTVMIWTAPSRGAEDVGETKGKWTNRTELSFVDTGGNTQVTTLAVKNDLAYSFTERLVGLWKVAILYGRSDGKTNAENYMTELRADYDFSDRTYGLAYVLWTRDTFSGIDSRSVAGAGPGYRFLTGPVHSLVGECGLSFTKEDYVDNLGKDYWGGRLYGGYRYTFSEKAVFEQSLEWLPDFSDFDDWILNSETAVTAALKSHLNLKASYTAKYKNRPVEDLDELDTVLGMALEISF